MRNAAYNHLAITINLKVTMKSAVENAPNCPIGRALEQVGQWWSILILREALYGVTRFDEFEKSLRIAPTMLTRRLKALVEAGVLERRAYSERPVRYEYLLTDAGRDFRPVIIALYSWGNKYLAPEGAAIQLVNAHTGAIAEPVLVDRRSGAPITVADFIFAPGPAATSGVIRRLNRAHPPAVGDGRAAGDTADTGDTTDASDAGGRLEPVAAVKPKRRRKAT